MAVVSADARLEELLKSSSVKVSRVRPGDWSALGGEAAPAALVLDGRRDPQVLRGLAEFRRQHPGAGIVLVVASFEPHLMLEAMRAGVSECVAEPLTLSALEAAIRRVLAVGQDDTTGQLFAFVGAKGGVGTTTLAVNVAAVLAQADDGGVLVIDWDAARGDAALFLGAEPRFSTADALEHVQRLDDTLFRSFVVHTAAGVDLLGSPGGVTGAAPSPETTRALIDFVQRRYRWTIVDIGRADPRLLDTLQPLSAIVIVATQEVSALRNTAHLSRALMARHGASRVRIVMNRFDQGGDVGRPDVERLVGGSIAHVVPGDYRTAVEALNTGRPVVRDKKSELARALRRAALDLAGMKTPRANASTSLLGRLAFRRA